MWFEIYRGGKLIKRGNEVLGDISWTSELMSVSSMSFDLPIDYLEWINGREEIKVFVNGKVFWGIITGVDLDKTDETMSINIDHIIHEWTYRQISVNNAIKGGKVQFVFKGNADKVKTKDHVSISANNFDCLPTATNLATLAGVQVWDDKGNVIFPDGEIEARLNALKSRQAALDKKYDSICNGNVVYAKQPLISGTKMQLYWPDAPEDEWYTVYGFGYTIGFSQLYTVEATPIQQNGDIWSEDELVSYLDSLNTNNGIQGVLNSDTEKRIIQIVAGDYDESVWEPWYEATDKIKQEELEVRLDIMELEQGYYPKYKLFEREEKDGEDPTYKEISSLPKPENENSTASCYVRFYAPGVKDLYVQVQATVKYDVAEDDGSIDISNASVYDQLSDIYDDANFAYPGWDIAYEEDADSYPIDYVYSRQDKLEALNKTIELTPDLWWRTPFVNRRLLEVGKFGKKQPYKMSVKREGESNICIIEEPKISYDFKNVVNVASVYSEKSDTGMSSMTLREVYNDPSLQEDGFPVVILRTNVNNERDYSKYVDQYPVIAPNNELEYAIIDEESVALEDGHLIEGTYAFTDLSAFQPEEDDEGNTRAVTDEDRVKAATEAYHAAIRKLKQDRRSYKIELTTTPLPPSVQVGDKVRLMYDNVLYKLGECNDYLKFLLSASDYGEGDDWFYITKITYHIEENEAENDEVTLEYFLKLDRETKEAI